MYKNLKAPQLHAWRMKITKYTKLFHAKQHFLKWIPKARKLQETRNKKNRIKEINRKLCTLATNDLILS